ncbi:MAG TPA: VPLPA-CTERM sorting domain-containing protein [Gammaproteobacteria bacterium]|nr:VPLPA-CTERM sorting domain-containing protein [Gammaproteobacteria bacterium]
MATASSVYTFEPTDTNVNIVNISTTVGSLGFFDNDNTSYDTSSVGSVYTNGYLPIDMANGDVMAYGSNPVGATTGSFTVSNNNGDQTTVTNGPYFTLAYNDGTTGWRQADGVSCSTSTDTCHLTWSGTNSGGTILGVDLKQTVPPSAVPVPAAVWLFGSGLIGLVGVARRKTA